MTWFALAALAAAVVVVLAMGRGWLEARGFQKLRSAVDALLVVSGTAFGVALGVYAAGVQQDHARQRRLENVRAVALAEVRSSLSMLHGPRPATFEMQGGPAYRLVLEHPARALQVLVGMPEFLETEPPASAAELIRLATLLDWQIEATDSGAFPRGPRVWAPDVVDVTESLHRACSLLAQGEAETFCGTEAP